MDGAPDFPVHFPVNLPINSPVNFPISSPVNFPLNSPVNSLVNAIMDGVKSWVEISAERLRANFRAVRTVAGPDFDVLAVIKADAYGHGAALCAPVLREAGAHWLGVTDVEEGIAVRAALAEDVASELTRILVMCGSLPADAAALVQHDLTPVIWTVEHVEALEAAAKAAGRRVRVHVEVDTGMSRQGAAAGAEFDALLARLSRTPWLVLEGLMTHLCCAETAGADATRAAESAFLQVRSALGAHAPLLLPEILHISNTSAVDEASTTRWMRERFTQYRLLPNSTMEAFSNETMMVRTGLALYGYCLPLAGEPREPELQPLLQPVMTWKARVIGLREIAAGTHVGYGATFTAARAMRLALLPVGYADGFRREASSGIGDGWVVLRGQRAPVVGRVSMNLTVVDVTALAGVAVGDEAVLLGEGVTAEDHAHWADTIAYEILCGVRGRRVLV